MADGKKTQLSIEIRAVDRATAIVRAINSRVKSLAKPTADTFKGIGSAIGSALSGIASIVGDVLDKIPVLGAVVAGAIGGAVAAVVHLVDKFDDLGKKAARVGVGVDVLADLRYAAEKTGVPLEALDEGLQSFSQNLGQARAGTGRMAKFLERVSPALLKQLTAAKSNEEAFKLLADAMAKLQDPAKRAALAQKTVGDAALAPLLAQGAKGIQGLADKHEQLAGSMKGATDAAAEAHDAMVDLHAAIDGAEAGIVVGLAPAMRVIVQRLSQWFVDHRADITEWAKKLGDELPGAIQKVVAWVENAIEKLGKFFGVLGDIYDKVKEIYNIGDAKEQAKAAAAAVPEAKRAQVAAEAEEVGRDTSRRRSMLLSSITGAAGFGSLAGTDIGDEAGEQAINAIGVGPGLTRNTIITGDYYRELAEQLKQKQADLTAQASSAVGGVRAPTPDEFAAAIAAQSGSMQSQAKVTIDVNAPRGTRVKTDPQSTADVDLNVGYQMIPGSL